MQVKNRSVEFNNAQKSQSNKNWVIGWTLTEANAAAQRQLMGHAAPKKIGSLGVLTPSDRR